MHSKDKRMRNIILLCGIILFLSGLNDSVLAQQNIPIFVEDSVINAYKKEASETPFYMRKSVEASQEDIIKVMDALPAFAIYKDVYFVTGLSLNKGISSSTADAMFQLSIRHRLTKSVLPFNTFLYLTYTQKSFWNIYARSSPFRDTNYNPGIGVGRYITKDNMLVGSAFVQIEHESNGQDEEDSRSWNYLSFSAKYFYNLRFSLGVKAWIPVVDGINNKDLIDYRGLATLSVNFMSKDFKWWLSADITPRKGFGNANTILTVAYKGSTRSNTHFYLRFSDGVGDSLLDYNRYGINIRAGICFKPDFYSIF